MKGLLLSEARQHLKGWGTTSLTPFQHLKSMSLYCSVTLIQQPPMKEQQDLPFCRAHMAQLLAWNQCPGTLKSPLRLQTHTDFILFYVLLFSGTWNFRVSACTYEYPLALPSLNILDALTFAQTTYVYTFTDCGLITQKTLRILIF